MIHLNKTYKKPLHLLFIPLLAIITIFLGSCSGNTISEAELNPTKVVEEIMEPTITPTIKPTEQPSPTATLEPTIEPTLEPTQTPIPELGIVDDGLTMWSVPQRDYYFVSNAELSREYFPEVFEGFIKNERMNVRIPASIIVVEVGFNQDVPLGVEFQIFNPNINKAVYVVEAIPSSEDPTKGLFFLNQNFILDPPFWEITYHAKLVGFEGKILWENDLRLFKPLPNTCWDGSLPDPVTLYCPNYDGDWNYRDFPNFNPNADIFTSGQVELGEEYKK